MPSEAPTLIAINHDDYHAVVDTIWYKGNPRQRMYKAGLTLAVVLSALPGVWSVVAWLISVYTGRKLD